MLPFPTLGSISECYNFDRYDDFIEGGKFGTVFRAQAISDRSIPYHRATASRSPSVSGSDRNVLSAGSFVALKQISKQNLITEKDFKDVVNEVEVLRQLHHRNCLHLYEAFQTSSTVVISMELVDEGEELMQALKSLCDSASVGPSGQVVGQRRSREEWCQAIFKQLLEGILYLHRDRRIVHRDMKPENILVCPDPSHEDGIRVVIVDYGLAKYIGRSPASSPAGGQSSQSAFAAANSRPRAKVMRQRSESILHRCDSADSVDGFCNSPVLSTPCGTMKFTAPETVRGILEKGPEPRTTTRRDILALDMYSIGIILFAMLTGKLPFPGNSQVDQARQMEAGPVYDNKEWSTISETAKDFVWKLLSPTPSERLTVCQALRHPWVGSPRATQGSPSQGSHSSSHLLGASFSRSNHGSPAATLATGASDPTSTMAELQGIYASFENKLSAMGSRRSTELAETEEPPNTLIQGLTRSCGPANNVASVDDLYDQLQLAKSRECQGDVSPPDVARDDEFTNETEDEASLAGTGDSGVATPLMSGGRCHSIPFGSGTALRPPPLITSANPYFGFACEE